MQNSMCLYKKKKFANFLFLFRVRNAIKNKSSKHNTFAISIARTNKVSPLHSYVKYIAYKLFSRKKRTVKRTALIYLRLLDSTGNYIHYRSRKHSDIADKTRQIARFVLHTCNRVFSSSSSFSVKTPM